MKRRHRLKLIGITYNQIESGVYAVILEEVNGDRRIPIIIGYAEAQAIECKLQEVKTPRPLTHDLMKSILDNFDMKLTGVEIYKLPTGVFAANLIIESADGNFKIIDARSSDALALAIRTNAPIYTSAEVLEEAGFRPRATADNPQDKVRSKEEVLLSGIDNLPEIRQVIESFEGIEGIIGNDDISDKQTDEEILEFLQNYSDAEIEKQISKFAASEKYEVAARLKALLKKRNEK